ncbi:MAG: MATE family efflux transporter [Lachnospiraceae bacterium]|nr:MATE family efflux transporter [Lachnospiraceae bacterium]
MTTNVFEEQNISKAVIKLGIPAMLGSLTTLVYNIADTYFVALTKTPAMIAAVTLCVPILLIIMSIACIFGMGGSSVMARMLGEGRGKDAAKCLNFCTYAMTIVGLIVLVLGLLFTEQIAVVAGADSENLAYTCDYLKWIFIGTPAIMLSNGLTHAFRSIGLIKEATIGMALGNGINIVLDWIFIVLLGMGTMGAALATSLGFVCGTLYYLICLVLQEKKGNICVKMAPKHFSMEKQMVGSVIKIGIPGALITVMLSVSNIVLNNFIGIYGSDAVASYGIAYKIDMFPIMLSVGLSQGAAPLVGYYFGQKNEKKLAKAMRVSILYGILLGAAFLVVLFFGNRLFAGVFIEDPALLDQTAFFLRLLCFHAPLLGIINMVTAYFQALGKAAASLTITILRNLALFIPGVMLMNYLFGLTGVLLTQFTVEVVISVICLLLYAINKPAKLVAGAK